MGKVDDWAKFRKKFLEGKKNHEGYYTCEKCGRWTPYIEVDHIKTRGARADLYFEPTNLKLLCNECHSEKHGVKW